MNLILRIPCQLFPGFYDVCYFENATSPTLRPRRKETKKIASAILPLILFKKLCTLFISVKHLEADIHTSQQLNPTPQAVPILQCKGDMLHCS